MYSHLKQAFTRGLPPLLGMFVLSIASAKSPVHTDAASLFNGQARRVYTPRAGRSDIKSVGYYWRDSDCLLVMQLNKNAEEGILTQYSVLQRTSKQIDTSRLTKEQSLSLVEHLYLSKDGTDFYISCCNHYRQSGRVYEGTSTPSVTLDAGTTLMDFAVSPTKQNAAWLLKRPVRSQASAPTTQLTLLVQIGKQGALRQIGSTTDWPEVNHNRDAAIHWSPDGKNLSFVRHNAVYILPAQ